MDLEFFISPVIKSEAKTLPKSSRTLKEEAMKYLFELCKTSVVLSALFTKIPLMFYIVTAKG